MLLINIDLRGGAGPSGREVISLQKVDSLKSLNIMES